MGNSGTKRTASLKKLFPNFNLEDWQQIRPEDASQRNEMFGNYRTYRNCITSEEIDRYELFFASDREKKIYEQCFLERLREDYLINAYHYEPISKRNFCSSTYGALVYIQHAPIRLSQITDIPRLQNLYILKCALLGFQKLYNSTGYFEVMQQQICIDREGHVRVWMNMDLSKNYPEGYEEDSEQSRDMEAMMVGEVIDLIEKNTEKGSYNSDNKSFVEFLQAKGNKFPTFRQAIELLYLYVRQNSLELPHYCEFIIEIFQDDYGEQFNLSYSGLDQLDKMEANGGHQQHSYSGDINSGENILNQNPLVYYEAPDQIKSPNDSNNEISQQFYGRDKPGTMQREILNSERQFNHQDDWKNESLKSSLKFVEAGNNEDIPTGKMSTSSQGYQREHNLSGFSDNSRASAKKPIVRFSYGSSNNMQETNEASNMSKMRRQDGNTRNADYWLKYSLKESSNMRNTASLNPSVNINDASRRQITEEETFEREDYSNDIDEEILRDLMELEELEGIETVF